MNSMRSVRTIFSGPSNLCLRSLHDVHLSLRDLKDTDFPEELQDSFREIHAKLETDLGDEQASEIAKKIVRLHDKLVKDYCLPISMQ
jgi:hypothetical protein